MKISIIVMAMLAFFYCKADQGQDIFNKACAPCHTIGKGRLVGPDLKNISEKRTQVWLIDFIQSSQSIIKSGDADAVAIYKEYNSLLMPDQPLDTEQVKALLNYINNAGSGIAETEGQEQPTDLLENASEENVAEGLLLFTGKNRFTNGGSACITCHTVKDDRIFSSGTLAKDLTNTYNLMGSAGVSAIVKNPPFPAMREAYINAPLTENEVLNLTAYLRSVDENSIYQHPVDFGFTFVIFGLIVFVLLQITISILYFNRKKESVNYKIFQRQTAVIN
ncbi:MAG: hypothetical protein CL661_06700 [Bacteroidetes bacterium]|jgi:mono/diheme cytochrome c family protein|nr:hypothetical protein [Bacteroidota bacterium]|tara:strand:+ start:3542 stop:4375 length:834 start_codon:yes stop_codon:yes gene_type:complete